MSIYKGTTLLSGVATNTITNAHDLFDRKWADHELNDQSWLNANTFSWQDGTVYSDAYSHLVADYSGGTSQTETIGSHTITFVEATDGHRITTDESTVADIYTESGVAWFYVLDTANQRFKLPRINPTREELIQIVRAKGNGNCLGIDGGSGDLYFARSFTAGSNNLSYAETGGANGTTGGSSGSIATAGTRVGINTDSTKSGIISDMTESTSVFKGNLYLYFYVGQFSQSATEQTAGLNASLFNGKVDLNAQNLSDEGKSLIAGLGMPSNTYEDLTLGASGAEYTAPANGWFFLAKVAGGTNQYISLGNSTTKLETTVQPYVNNATLRVYLPAKKGDTIFAEYNASGALRYFRFIYAEGSESEAS